jgi:hypothetical protein
MEGTLRMSVSEILSMQICSWTKVNEQMCRQICSTVKFA